MGNARDLTDGPVWRHLANLAGPMVLGIIAVISVSLVDTYFVGKLGTAPLAALSYTFPVSLTVTSLAIGLSAGAASTVSRAIGANNRQAACRLSTDSLVLSIAIVLVVSAVGYTTIDPVFKLLGASGEVLDMIRRYMRIWYVSMPFLVVPMVANAIIRSVGDALWPSIVMIGSALINVISTPLLIFGWGPIPPLDIEGAAWGTVVARISTLIFAVWLIVYREKMVVMTVPPAHELIASWKEVLTIGLPAAVGNAVNPLGIAVATAIVATFGDPVVAAFGVATRIESFAVIPMLALSSAIGPISGQNWGAGNPDRVACALKISYATCLAWAMVLALVFWLAAEPLSAMFSSDEEVASTAAMYLAVVPLSVWGYGWVIVAAGGYNAIGKPVAGLSYYLIRTALLYIPLSFAASLWTQSWGVFVAIAVANALSGILVAGHSLWWLKARSSDAAESAAAA
jgi:putative MATE family efflux protein